MTALEQIRKAYQDARKNDFWDAWGIVASPKTIYDLRAECLEQMVVYSTAQGMTDSVFGLVLIPCTSVGNDVAYVVDEQLGRTILGEEQDEREQKISNR